MRHVPALPLALALGIAVSTQTPASGSPKVVADILPVHGLVAAAMEGVETPTLMVDGAASPHSFALRPSQVRALSEADLVVGVGPGLAPAITRTIGTVVPTARALTLLDLEGTLQLEYREGALFEHHDEHHAEGHHGEKHDEHHAEGHERHDDDHHGHHDDEHHAEGHHGEKHDEHHAEGHERHDDEHHAEGHHGEKHDEHHAEGHERHDDDHHGEGHEGHHHDGVDPHAWLDPRNAALWLDAIVARLAAVDPENADAYRANAERAQASIDAAAADAAATLAPVRGRSFLVFHDAYHYFEHRFGIEAAGAISLGDAADPGAARLAELRTFLREADAVCVFIEPQYNAGLAERLVEGTGARIGTLDPLGSDIPPGPGHYPALIRSMATALAGCLSG